MSISGNVTWLLFNSPNHLTLANNLVQGPLAGYSCAPFRVLAQRYGQPGFCSSEMISVQDLIHRKVKPKRYLWRDPEEKVVCYQLSSNKSAR